MKFLVLENVAVPLGPGTVIQANDDVGVYVYVNGLRYSSPEDYSSVLEVMNELGVI